MLRRNNSRNHYVRPLSRSKSTTSITPKRQHAFEFIDPSVAARDANIAAVLSFRRAQNKADDMNFPLDSASLEDSEPSTISVRHGLERTGSVASRQDPSASISRQQSIRFARTPTHLRRAQVSKTNGGQESSVIHNQGAMTSRPSSTMSYNNKSDAYTLTRRYLDSMHPPEECFHPEDNATSLDVPFRGLRKSRSMFASDRARIGYSFSSGSSERVQAAPDHQSKASSIGISLRKSTSVRFSKRRNDPMTGPTTTTGNDAAVQMAQEKFHELSKSQTRVPSQTSTFFRSKNKQSEAFGLRKSLRNSSNSTMLSSAISTNSIVASKQSSLRQTARKVSHGLRSKLRGLFTQSKASSEVSKEVHDECVHDSDESSLQADEYLAEEGSICQVASHLPSLHDVPFNQQLRSRKGSVESINSIEHRASDEKSRVTSWTNSVVTSVTDWDQQRLSIIKEDGAHVSSSSFQPDQLNSNGYPRPVDSQRVYSALMKRMEEKNGMENRFSIQHQPEPASSRTPVAQNRAPRWKASTIRVVHDDHALGDQGGHDQLPCSDGSRESRYLDSTPVAHDATPSYATSQQDASPIRPASLRSNLGPPRVVSHRSSAFFASPVCHTFSSPSPYRRALQESARNLQSDQASSHTEYEESVYSHTTEDYHQDCIAKRGPETDANDPKMEISRQSTSGFGHERSISNASSVEWKTWLSADVSKIESPRTPTAMDRTDLPRLGHVREDAEINSPGEAFVPEHETPTLCSPSKPSRGVNQRANDHFSSWSSSRKSMPRSDENEAPGTRKYSKFEPPTIPPRNSLRSIPSLPVMNDGLDKPVAEVQRMRSFNTIGRLQSTPEESLLKRRSRARLTRWKGSPTKSSPGGSSPSRRSIYATQGMDNEKELQGSDMWESEVGTRVLGSKGMVDSFLNSRRRDCNDGRGSSPAFV